MTLATRARLVERLLVVSCTGASLPVMREAPSLAVSRRLDLPRERELVGREPGLR